jgi:spore coat protein A, manganese oxidase
MSWSRREFFRRGGMALPFLSASCLRPRPESRLLPSLAPLPSLFQARMPIPSVARAVKTDAGTDFYEFVARPADAQILPGLTTRIWGFEGVFPGPTIEAQRGRRISLRLRNQLPVPLVYHLHGGHTAPESDGYPTDLILPPDGFPPAHMHDPLAHVVSGEREYLFENDQRAATLWYHDHRMDFTAPQVWRGLAGLYILRDSEEDRLNLPRGDRAIPLIICDRSFAADGSFRYPVCDPQLRQAPAVVDEYMGGVLGDVILVNGAPWPRLEVSNAKYRFRILNCSNARRYELALDPPPNGTPSFVQIGSDGGLLAAPLAHRTLRIAPAERFDVVVDFSTFQVGSSVTLINTSASGRAGQIMRFDITRSERDDSVVPARLSDIPDPRPEEATLVRDFDFSFARLQHGWMINGKPFDPERMDASPRLNSTEIWRIQTDFSHPLHLHLAHFRVLSHGGRPGPYDSGWKDTIDLSPGQGASLLMRFDGYRGRYVFHCHNLEHEDMSMMGNFEVI